MNDDGIAPLCANLGRFKRLVTINLVSWGVCERGVGGLLVRLLLLTCVEQWKNEGMSDAVKREITQVLQEGQGADKGLAVASSCCFFDFETCKEINLSVSNVRLLSLHDVA